VFFCRRYVTLKFQGRASYGASLGTRCYAQLLFPLLKLKRLQELMSLKFRGGLNDEIVFF